MVGCSERVFILVHIFYINVENIGPDSLSPSGIRSEDSEESLNVTSEKTLYCGKTLWRHSLAKLSCDFGPLKRHNMKSRRKRRSLESEKERILHIITERLRQRESPEYYVMDDTKLSEEYASDSDDALSLGSLIQDDLPDIQDSGGTQCYWESSSSAWKVQRLIDSPLSPDYYTDFLHEISEREDFDPDLLDSNQDLTSLPTESSPDNSDEEYFFGLFDDGSDSSIFFSEDSSQHTTSGEADFLDFWRNEFGASLSSAKLSQKRRKRSQDKMNILMYSDGPPFDATTESTTGDGYYLMWHAKAIRTDIDMVSNTEDQFFSPFFSNSYSEICLNFKYFIHTDFYSARSKNIEGGLLVYLLPCHPAYKEPVLNLTGQLIANKTDRWVQATTPLPRHRHPYQVIFEGVRPKSQALHPDGPQNDEIIPKVTYIALDDIIFSECGK